MESYLTAEISPSAVEANLAYIRSRLAGGAKLCAVVKADALGHGVSLLWRTIARRADWLAVATPQEAIQLRDLGYEGPLLQFLPPCAFGGPRETANALAELIARRVTLTVSSAGELGPIRDAAPRAGRPAEIHVKVDTGMGRSGIAPQAALDLIAAARSAGTIRLTGLYTHLATADDPDKARTLEQLRLFRELAARPPRREELLLHAANSAATLSLPESHLDMVRCGVAVVGYQLAYSSLADRLPLRPSMRLWAPLVQVKSLPAGAGVGYGLSHTLRRPSVVGLVPVGYGDGYLRCLSNRATMRVGGQGAGAAWRDAPVVGRVSMDQTILDLTDCPGAKVGEEVEIISPDPAGACSLENLSRLAGTIPQELACRLACRVRRTAGNW